MAKYFGIYANENERNSAVTSSAITRPYVALVDGQLDYDSYWDGRYYLIINGDDSVKYWLGLKEYEPDQIAPYICLNTEATGETGSGVYYGVNFDTDSYFSVYKSNGKSDKHIGLGGYWEYCCTNNGDVPCLYEASTEQTNLDDFGIGTFEWRDCWPEYSDNVKFELCWGIYDEGNTRQARWTISVDCDEVSCCEDEQTRCENAGGTWVDDGEGGGYCDCDGSDECECAMSGGEWVDDGEGNYTCQYPEEEDPGE